MMNRTLWVSTFMAVMLMVVIAAEAEQRVTCLSLKVILR